jgi:NAD(P)-dependent dehydrogenase (short-subunit alcohol dehydrogenase family)
VSRPGRLEGRACLIVGGTGGIGLASARRFLEEGARVVVAGLDDEAGPQAAARLSAVGPVWFAAVDVREPSSVDLLFRQALTHLGGRLDVLFHVAGASGRRFGDAPLAECSVEGWDAVIDLNTRGTFLTNRAAVRQMRVQACDEMGLRGTVLNVGSVVAHSPSPRFFGTYAYAASKGAIEAMTRAAASAYAPEKIRFNLLAPALVDTPMSARATSDPAIRGYLATKQPIASGPGTAADCAEAALYLCEPASRFVTGAVLAVDGGWSLAEGQYRDEAAP